MNFTTVCLRCGHVFRLLDRYRGRKVMCPDCHRPFIAQSIREEVLEVADGQDALPASGWLLVCPACGHTELVAEGNQRQAHCSRCGTALGAPRIASRRIRKRKRPPAPEPDASEPEE